MVLFIGSRMSTRQSSHLIKGLNLLSFILVKINVISSKTRCTSKCTYTWDLSSLDFGFLLKTGSKHIKHQINKIKKVKFTKMSFQRNACYSKTMKELELINTDAENIITHWIY